ncbi:UBC-like protein [Trichocladium antarcticum]|uniref:UBC-like protein n=1 Tax=Trichocladium antarcticum TaxID=1450529 RepID=A0AAN6USL8_9PEZI|nr:UBC-like protein [Trichocladium antarcticum]
MATPQFNSKSPTIRRILREAHELATSPSPDYHAAPLDTDLFEWHFTLRGPPHSAFATGIYHGRIVLPPAYPLRPPAFRFATPSGRFEPNRELCLSISGHHEETWQPAWGVRTALVALRSFMETDVRGQLGGVEAAEAVRRRLAAESGAWRCGVCCGGKSNAEILVECEERVREMGAVGEEKVPEELRMGWRDEMGKKKEGEEEEGEEEGVEAGEDEESAMLAEGFVQTTSAPAPSAAGAAPGPAAGPPVARPVPPPRPAHPALQPVVAQRVSDDVWLDRLIMVLAVLLAAVVAKVMLA